MKFNHFGSIILQIIAATAIYSPEEKKNLCRFSVHDLQYISNSRITREKIASLFTLYISAVRIIKRIILNPSLNKNL